MPFQPVVLTRWKVVGAFLLLVFSSIAVAIWNDHRIDQAEKRITRNTAIALHAAAKVEAAQQERRLQAEQIHQNSMVLARLTRTTATLCTAVSGARRFWIGVRNSTVALLRDPTLSAIERASNEHFLRSLNAVIDAAHDLAHSCRGQLAG